jgi:hypothetical protein
LRPASSAEHAGAVGPLSDDLLAAGRQQMRDGKFQFFVSCQSASFARASLRPSAAGTAG